MGDGPGLVIIFGSGEAAASGRRVYDWLFRRLPSPPCVAVLETPAGFQPNSALVAERVAEFVREHLQGYRPMVTVVPARRRGTPFSPDDPSILAPLLEADAIFLGAGSPTYAVRQLTNSLAWEYLVARHRQGSAVILASAAAIAAGTLALPVYEIFKAGADLHWIAGLDLFRAFGLRLVFVPHWNNNEGGTELDTSRCFMGQDRFRQLLALIDLNDVTVVGIDEHTALVIDPEAESCRVMGRGGVTILRRQDETPFQSGQAFPAAQLGPFRLEGIDRPPSTKLTDARRATRSAEDKAAAPPPEVLALVEERDAARRLGDWPLADSLRQQIARLGWRVVDTAEGPRLELA